mmetsp:Transcript_32017/g.81372  ORF Transcript_32017/g.81372 Transcript_32017/m.81372 type:complete len:99 (-) Transcript_32017:307-603(-)
MAEQQAKKEEQKKEEEEEEPQCPICAFIEGGACKQTHRDWVKCRDEAQEKGQDYVEACQDKFKVFLQCTFDNADYYEPFHAMLQGLEEGVEAPDAQRS